MGCLVAHVLFPNFAILCCEAAQWAPEMMSCNLVGLPSEVAWPSDEMSRRPNSGEKLLHLDKVFNCWKCTCGSCGMESEVGRHSNEYRSLTVCDMPFYDISRLWERGGLMHIA